MGLAHFQAKICIETHTVHRQSYHLSFLCRGRGFGFSGKRKYPSNNRIRGSLDPTVITKCGQGECNSQHPYRLSSTCRPINRKSLPCLGCYGYIVKRNYTWDSSVAEEMAWFCCDKGAGSWMRAVRYSLQYGVLGPLHQSIANR